MHMQNQRPALPAAPRTIPLWIAVVGVLVTLAAAGAVETVWRAYAWQQSESGGRPMTHYFSDDNATTPNPPSMSPAVVPVPQVPVPSLAGTWYIRSELAGDRLVVFNHDGTSTIGLNWSVLNGDKYQVGPQEWTLTPTDNASVCTLQIRQGDNVFQTTMHR